MRSLEAATNRQLAMPHHNGQIVNPGESYTCAFCGKVEPLETSEEEMLAEMQADFGHISPPEDRMIVCDDCYKKIHPARN